MDKLFTTKSCTQCQALKPHLTRNNIVIETIDAEEDVALAATYGIMKVPTIVKEDGTQYVGGGECMRYVSEVTST